MDVRLPRLGEGADSGVVATVFVKEGDQVKKDQPVLELESEKAVASIPAPSAGTVTKIFVKEGDEIKVGGLIMILSERANGGDRAEGSAAGPGAAGAEGGAVGASAAGAAPASVAGPSATRKPATADTAPLRLIDASVGDESPGETSFDVLPAGAGDGALRSATATALSASFPIVHPQGAPPPASPSLRKIARELGIDLHRVPGSERGGRIVMSDLRAYVARIQQLALRPASGAASSVVPKPTGAPQPTVAPKPTVAPSAPAPRINFAAWGEVSPEKMTTLRKAISRKMTESWSTVPHIAQFDEVDVTDLLALRKKYAAKYEAKKAHLTLTSFALRAVVRTLRKHPRFNASIDEAAGEIILKKYFHIGIAVDTEQGLIVPVLRNVDTKSIFELSVELHELAERTRLRKVALEEMQGGTFTISNQGGIGSGHFTPIINTPEVAILGMGRGVVKPVVREGKTAQRTMMPVTLSYDHRVNDGADAARFMVDLVKEFAAIADADVRA